MIIKYSGLKPFGWFNYQPPVLWIAVPVFHLLAQSLVGRLTNNSEETLNRVAIVDPSAGIEGFQGQFGDEEKDGIKLIAIGSKYFNNDLPRCAPQFMVLYWRWTEHPTSLNFKKQFEENFPLEKLRAMIDK